MYLVYNKSMEVLNYFCVLMFWYCIILCAGYVCDVQASSVCKIDSYISEHTEI